MPKSVHMSVSCVVISCVTRQQSPSNFYSPSYDFVLTHFSSGFISAKRTTNKCSRVGESQ